MSTPTSELPQKSPQKLSWYQRAIMSVGSTALWAGWNVIKITAQCIPPTVSKVAQVYSHLPTIFKIPIEGYAIYQYSPFQGALYLAHLGSWGYARFAPDKVTHTPLYKNGKDVVSGLSNHPLFLHSAGKISTIAGRVVEEAPLFWQAAKETGEHLRDGKPFNALGHRIAITDNHPGDSQQHLQNIDQKLAAFEERQPVGLQGSIPELPKKPTAPPSEPVSAPTGSPALPGAAPPRAVGPDNPVQVENRIAATDRECQHLSDNLAYFIPLYTMMGLAGIDDSDPEAINSMVREAQILGADGKKVSVKEVFHRRYGDRLNKLHKFKIWVFNLFGSSRIFSKTVHAYMRQILTEMRMRLSDTGWTAKEEKTARLINDLMHFLDVYKNATFNYADAKKPKGTLSEYRARELEKMFGKPLVNLCGEFSETVIEHLSPQVQYFEGTWFLPRFGNWLSNIFVKKIISHYLPGGVHSTILSANDATKPHNLPFAKAMTDAAAEQLTKLLKDDSSPPPPLVPGSKQLRSAIENLFYVVQFSNATTQEAIKAKREEIKAKLGTGGLDEKIQTGIQDSILKGTQVLLGHLSVPENSEEMFTKFFELANAPFTSGEVVTADDFQKSKEKLEVVVRNVGRKLAKEAVEEEIRATRPEQVERSAQQAFETHRQDVSDAAERLQLLSQSISQKIGQLAHGWNPESDILRDLDSMLRVLKDYSTKEQIASDLKALPEADREGILRPLIPLYQNIEHLTSKLLKLQEQQLLHKAHFQIAHDLFIIETGLIAIGEQDLPEDALPKIPPFLEAIDRMAKCLPPHAVEIKEMKEKIKEFESGLRMTALHAEKLSRLSLLEAEILKLKASIEENRPDQRKICLENIRQILKLLPPSDNKILDPLIRGLNTLRLPAQLGAFNSAWLSLQGEIGAIQERYDKERKASIETLPPLLPFQEWVRNTGRFYQKYQAENAEEMAREGAALTAGVERLQNQVRAIQREDQLQLKPRHFGIIGGTALGILALFNPVLAATIGAGAFAAVGQIGPLLQGGENRTVAGIHVAGHALVGAGTAAALSAIPVIGAPLAIAGAAIAGGAVGINAIDGVIDGGQEKVNQEITAFFDKAYEFVLAGDIYKPLAKIAMQQVVASYATPAS